MNWPQRFRASAVSCGLKKDGEPDLALVVSEVPCRAAGVFTRNRVCAAPVRWCRHVLETSDAIRGVVINSKNANAVTGEQGERDARRLADRAAERLASEEPFLVMSTGVIGQPMPMHLYEPGLERCCDSLGSAGPEQLARAMMTTDTVQKVVARELDGTQWVGVAKGAGMIHPDMATLLALVVTDAALPPEQLQDALREATDRSFNCITVDGDTSTNDTLLLLANGVSGQAPARWQTLLCDMLQELARLVAFDGEGASHRVTLHVRGLATFEEARAVGRTVLTSPLVKTAIAGKDANWGRILAAAGRAGVAFDPGVAELSWNGLSLLSDGTPTNPGAEAERSAVRGESVELVLRLGDGPGEATIWSCDLTHEYVSINGDYRT